MNGNAALALTELHGMLVMTWDSGCATTGILVAFGWATAMTITTLSMLVQDMALYSTAVTKMSFSDNKTAIVAGRISLLLVAFGLYPYIYSPAQGNFLETKQLL